MAYNLLILSDSEEFEDDIAHFCYALEPKNGISYALFRKGFAPTVPFWNTAFIEVEAWAGPAEQFLDAAGANISGTNHSRTIAISYSNNANCLAALTACTDFLIEGVILIRPTASFDRVPSKPLKNLPMLILSGIDDPTVTLADVALLGVQLSMAGANVTHRNLPNGHGLSRHDHNACEEWLASLPLSHQTLEASLF